jgi:hypothetical protein
MNNVHNSLICRRHCPIIKLFHSEDLNRLGFNFLYTGFMLLFKKIKTYFVGINRKLSTLYLKNKQLQLLTAVRTSDHN